MKCPDASLCQIPKGNSQLFYDHFRTLYSRQPHFDKSVLDHLWLHPVFKGFDRLPTDNKTLKQNTWRIWHHDTDLEKFIRLQRNI